MQGATDSPGCDVRIGRYLRQFVITREANVQNIVNTESTGAGVRVIADGAWGFAATDDLTREGIDKAVFKARAIAKASAMAKLNDVVLAPEQPWSAEWTSPCAIDPFQISVQKKLDYLLKVDEALRSNKAITLTETSLYATRTKQWFANSEGSLIAQTRTVTGAGCACYAFADGDRDGARDAKRDGFADGNRNGFADRHRNADDNRHGLADGDGDTRGDRDGDAGRSRGVARAWSRPGAGLQCRSVGRP